jgi:type II secretory pathway pseudopilin PulG
MNMSRRRWGITLIELLVVLSIITLLLAILIPAVRAAREGTRRTQCRNNLRQIGIAIQNYNATYGVFPFGVGADADTQVATIASASNRRYSLHSQILPYLEQAALFNQVNFSFQPFYPDMTGDPRIVTGIGPNETVAQVKLGVFLCPSDYNRMTERPWGPTNYRSCTGSSWSARVGNGMFGQVTSIRTGGVVDGLSNTAALSERILGDDDDAHLDIQSDIFALGQVADELTFRAACDQLTETSAVGIQQRSNSGHTWLEGNMSWTRYNHLLGPGRPSCNNLLTWYGTATSANSHHKGGVHLLLGDGVVRFVGNPIDVEVWRGLGTINGGEQVDW